MTTTCSISAPMHHQKSMDDSLRKRNYGNAVGGMGFGYYIVPKRGLRCTNVRVHESALQRRPVGRTRDVPDRKNAEALETPAAKTIYERETSYS